MPKLLPALVLFAALAFAISPLFTEPFTGFNPDQLPRPITNPPIQPAGYAFAIWGAIYLWLVAGAAFGLLRRADAPEWQPMRPPLLLSLAIGAAWIPVALMAPVTATLLIIAMLITALVSLFRAPTSEAAVAAAPVALYAGWLSAAAIVASATIVVAYTGLDPNHVSIAGLVIIGIVASVVIRYTAHPLPYATAVIWALVGVIVANSDADTPLVLGAAVGIIVVVAARTIQRLRPQT